MYTHIWDFQEKSRYCCRKSLLPVAKGSPDFTVMGFFYARTGRNRTVLYPRFTVVMAVRSSELVFVSGKGNTVFLLPENQKFKGNANFQQEPISNLSGASAGIRAVYRQQNPNHLPYEPGYRFLPGTRAHCRGARYHAGNHVCPARTKSTSTAGSAVADITCFTKPIVH